MRMTTLAGAGATTTLVLGAVVALAPAQTVVRGASPSTIAKTIAKFDHAQHAALDLPVDVAKCETCHGSDAAGTLAVPGQHGHQPCLRSGCHAEDFLSVGERTRRDSPDRYAKAAVFCRGCHDSAAGQTPAPFRKAAANNTYRLNDSPGHFVEFDHLVHSERTACRNCHVVDPESFDLDLESPGHRECATCHKDEASRGMTSCTGCHREGSPQSYFKERKFKSDVRACQSTRYKKLAERAPKSPPCFKHERKGHRFRANGEPVQCGDCHFMFRSKSYEGHDYQSLLGIKQAPLMDNSRDRAHQKCGAAGCHTQEVDDSKGQGRCGLCHSQKAIVHGLLDEAPKVPSEPSPAPPSNLDRKRDTLNDLLD